MKRKSEIFLIVSLVFVLSACAQNTDSATPAVSTGGGTLGIATTPDPHTALETLTTDLVSLNGTGAAGLTEKAELRRDLLLEVVDQDPAEVLKVALSKKMKKSMREDIKPFIEDEVDNIEGQLGITNSFSIDGKE